MIYLYYWYVSVLKTRTEKSKQVETLVNENVIIIYKKGHIT